LAHFDLLNLVCISVVEGRAGARIVKLGSELSSLRAGEGIVCGSTI
jgi:hypothetical protein